MLRFLWLPVGLACFVAGLRLGIAHNELGNRFHLSPAYLRSHILIVDSDQKATADLPIRRDLHPQLFEAKPEDFQMYADLRA